MNENQNLNEYGCMGYRDDPMMGYMGDPMRPMEFGREPEHMERPHMRHHHHHFFHFRPFPF